MNVVARGKIQVDARKALAKLRDHMLVDGHLYATEVARVAVGCKATVLHVDYDTDDVVFTFDGAPLDPAQIARARDHVLTPTTEGDGLALHALGIAVSAALGLGPSFVDVYAGNGSACSRVRFEPKHIQEDGEEGAPAVDALERPLRSPGLEGPWMRFHMRRTIGLDVLGRAIRGAVPREIDQMLARTEETPLTIDVRGEPVARRERRVVAIVDLDEPGATRARIEIFAPGPHLHSVTELCERSVRLASYQGIGAWPEGEEDLPARVVVDLPKLPTNASRSEVRFDADVVKRVRSRIPEAFAAAVKALAAVVVEGSPPEAVTTATFSIVEKDREVLEDTLGAIVAQAALGRARHAKIGEAAEALVSLPLLRTALGEPIALDKLGNGTKERPLLLYSGAGPAPKELAPWLAGVVWRRRRAIERALDAIVTADAAHAVVLATEGLARRQRALSHPPSAPVLASSPAYLFKETFEVKQGPFAGLSGEIAVKRRERVVQRAGIAHVYVESRVIEAIPMSAVTLPVDIAIEWPGTIRARFAYDGVEREEPLTRAMVYALRLAAIAVGEHLGERDPELVRLAILAWAGATKELGDAKLEANVIGPLAQAPAWKTTTGSFVSFQEVLAYVARTHALCTGPEGGGAAPDGRPVIVTTHADQLRPFLEPTTKIVPYGRALGKTTSDASVAIDMSTSVVRVPIWRPNIDGWVGLGSNQRRVYHAGAKILERTHIPRNGPVLVVVDDRTAVPGADWDSAVWVTPIDVSKEEDALLVLALERGEDDDATYAALKEYLDASRSRLLERAMKATGKTRDELAAQATRIEELPAKLVRKRTERARGAVLARPKEDPFSGIEGVRGVFEDRSAGTVTVMLEPSASGRPITASPVLLFDGRMLGSAAAVDLPLRVAIDLTKEGYLVEWTRLTMEGADWAKGAIDEAAKRLLLELAKRSSFPDDERALELAIVLMERSPLVAYSVSSAVTRASWPTVQGATMSVFGMSKVPCGRKAYPLYHREALESAYDAPAVHIPDSTLGRLRRSVLAGAGCELLDVSDAIARLQSRRMRGLATASPKLEGAPEHAALRASFAALGFTELDGEIELAPEPPSIVRRVDETGATTPVEVDATMLGAPVRAIFQTEQTSDARIARDLADAAERLLRNSATKLSELPEWMRARVRVLVCTALRKREDDAVIGFAVFPDTAGGWHSLRALRLMQDVTATTDLPPYPTTHRAKDGRMPTLCLAPSELDALRTTMGVDDVTAIVREELSAERRRNAPPLEELALSPALRAACIHRFGFETEGVRGEIGILAPQHAPSRGIAVHTTMRPLCIIPDTQASWPIVAAVDAPGVDTTRAFDGLAKSVDAERIRRIVRGEARARFSGVLTAPPEVRVRIRLPMPYLAGKTPCLGLFWLEPKWPETPDFHLMAGDVNDPYRLPRLAPEAAVHHGVLPIRGILYVAATGAEVERAVEQLLLAVRGQLAAALGSLVKSKTTSADELEAYTWDLAMLGATTDRDVAAEGRRDRPNPVFVRVAARRAPHLLGSSTSAPLGPKHEATPAENVALAAREMAAMHFQPGAEDAAQEKREPETTDEPVDFGGGFLAGVARRVVASFAPKPPPSSKRGRDATSPLAKELLASLAALKLPGDPVVHVADATRGRPVRYHKGEKRIDVNAKHASVRALEGRRDRLAYLLMAAVSEINRELEGVTDAEETAVLVDLLRTLPAATAQ